MKIHHLNCSSLCPIGGRLVNRRPALLVCHCLLIETSSGLVLIDTGFGVADMRNSFKRLGPVARLIGARLSEDEAAVNQVKALGFSPDDVRHIILTHMDLDHAGGLSDFPKAQIHVHRAEHAAAMTPLTYFESHRYRAVQWAHRPNWK
jgi:glyoxylase-like metal-dependent hydrolase (beta-lactamase superfamily II)